jgi:putative ABC transport system permease protein
VSPLLFRSSLRHLGRHPLLTGLSVLGIALGVAVVVAIDLASGSARLAFELANDTVSGKATDQVVGATADSLGDDLYRVIRVELGIADAAPVVEGYATAASGVPARALRVLGVDPFAERPFRAYGPGGQSTPRSTEGAGGGGGAALARLLTEPGAALVSARLARQLGLAPSRARVDLLVGGVRRTLSLAGTLPEPAQGAPEAAALDDVVVTDIATAQEWLGQVGRLTHIDLLLPPGPAGDRTRARIVARCGHACQVVPVAARSGAAAQMTRAFTLNLQAMSFLALLVGMFLIYNTMTFSVVQRRPLLGTLRALGVTRGEVFGLVLGEAVLLAVPATALGVGLGIGLATELVRLVTRTINDLYFVVNVRSLHLDGFTLGKGIALGLGATLLAALAPAREATRIAPTLTLRRSFAEARLARRAGGLALAGVGLAVAATGLLALSGRSLGLAYVGLFAILAAAALATPFATRAFARLARPPVARLFGITGTLAARGIVASLTRTSVALAALTIAVATTVGVGIMVDSFRGTVVEWLGMTLQADIFVGPPSLVARKGDATLLPAVLARIAATPGVAAINTIRNRRVRTANRDGVDEVGEVDLHVPTFGAPSAGLPPRSRPYRFRRAVDGDVYAALEAPDALAVSEPYAFHQQVGVGSRVVLITDRGPRPLRVVAVYTDYASDEGGLMLARSTYERLFDDRGISALSIVAAPGADLARLRAEVAAAGGTSQALVVRANRELRDASIAIFDRTFLITQVLRMLAVGVAFVGVLSALMALALERARELAVLRAIGLVPRQLVGVVTMQTSLMGLCAGILSLPLGVGLALILVYVINRRSFGWTLALELSPRVLAEAIALAWVAALLAGIYPAWKMSRANPARALRDE